MQGYTCVKFADICRLCATNCMADKVGIFDEQGVRLGLQDKLEKLIDIKVRFEDYLPKVLCCKCVMKLEGVQNLRNVAQSSEVTLNNFYERAQNFNHFKTTGMVYIQNNELRTIQADTPNVSAGTQVPHLEEAEVNVQSTQNIQNIVQVVKVQSPKKERKPSQQTLFKIVEVKGPPTFMPSMPSEQDAQAQDPLETERACAKPEATKTLIVQVYKSDRLANGASEAKAAEVRAPAAAAMGPEADDVETVTSSDQSSSANDEALMVRKYVCSVCGKRFRRREHLFQHTKLHSGARPWKCKTCPKSFMRKEHLLRHEILHTGQKDYSCELCMKSFARHDNLLKHRKIHEKDRQYTCELCHKVFVLQRYYDQHMRTAHDRKRKAERIQIIQSVDCSVGP